MRQFSLSAGIKLVVASLFLCGAYYLINYSNYYYLFFGNILLLLGLAFLVEGVLFLLLGLIKNIRLKKNSIILTSRFTFIILFITDFIIRLTGTMQTYSEQAEGNYFSIAEQENLDSWYWVHPPNTVITNQKKEFLFSRNVNSIGISEREVSKDKGSTYRILALGDSFTEGVGTSYEDSWVKEMEERWKSHNVSTINGGIGGSDPVFEFVLYRDKLTQFNSNFLILTINSTDVYDIISRGGFERFHADGTAGKSPPSWEWIYASNHLFRMIAQNVFGYNTNLIKEEDPRASKQRAVEVLKDVITRFKELTTSQETQLLVVLQPSIQEFKNGKHTPFFGQTELANFLKREKINYLDTSRAFEKMGVSITDYYYPLDTHFNKKGYALFGRTIYEKMEKLKLLD